MSEDKFIKFSLYEGEIERLKAFNRDVADTIRLAVTYFLAHPAASPTLAYQKGQLRAISVQIPGDEARRLSVAHDEPADAVGTYLAHHRPKSS